MTFNKLTRLTKTIIFIMSVAAAFTLLLSFMLSFDPQNGYFRMSALPIIFIIIYASGIIASIILPHVASLKPSTVRVQAPNKGIANTQAILSVLCVFAGLATILFYPSITLDEYVYIGLGSVFFGLYFLIAAPKPNSKMLKLILLAPSLALPFGIIFGNNSNFARHINSVENILCAIFCIFFSAYIYNKGRNLSDDRITKWQLGFNLAAVFTGSAFSVSYIFSFLLGSVNEISRLFHAVIMLFVSLICASDLFTVRDNDVEDENASQSIETPESFENPENSDNEEQPE